MLKLFIFLLLLAASQVLARRDHCGVMKPEVQPKPFRGSTIFRTPFVEKDHATGKLRGFFVDLLDEMAKVGNFTYTLENFERGKKWNIYNHKESDYWYPAYLVDTLNSDDADFTIGHSLWQGALYTGGENFTRPWITSGLSVMARGYVLNFFNITSFDDLMKLLDNDDPPIDFHAVGEPEKWHNYKPKVIWAPNSKGIYRNRLLWTKAALVQSSHLNKLDMIEDCSLVQMPVISKTIPVTEEEKARLYKRKYAIAVSNCFRHKDKFHEAFNKVEESGKLEELRKKYWDRKCDLESWF